MYSQELPPIKNFKPIEYKAENQNWQIAQAPDKNIYIANNEGLLEYNGGQWTVYQSPNNTIIRSVTVKDEKIYTGCHMEFGYWEKNKFNNLTYKSLSSSIKHKLLDDEQFWKIITYDNWILFQSLQRIYMYDINAKTFKIINSKTSLPKSFKVRNQVYFQKINQGLFRIENGKAVLISDAPILKENIVINIFYVNEEILLQTQERGFYYLRKNKLLKWQIPFNNILDKVSVYSSIRLKDNSFVLGTISKGLYHISEKGKLLNHINREKGLQNNTVLSLFEDAENNIWLGLDNGISVINLKSAFKVYNDILGDLGTVYTSIVHNGTLYLGTNQGLFYRENHSSEKFSFIPGTKGQVWKLKQIDNALFCGHNSGTFLIKNKKATLISSVLGTWDIKKVSNYPNLLIQGNYQGLHVLEKKNDQWKYRNKIKGFDISSRYFELFNQFVFVNHEYKGIFKLKISEDFLKVEDYNKIEVENSFKSSISLYNNQLLLFGKGGFYRYNSVKNNFTKDSILTKQVLNSDTYLSGKIITLNKKNMWVFTKENVVLISPGKFSDEPEIKKIALPIFFRENIIGEENITQVESGVYLLGTSNGYMLIDLQEYKDLNYEVSIQSISINSLNSQKQPLSINHTQKLDSENNNLSFTYSVPAFNKFATASYQYKLKGLHNEWSQWSEKTSVSFENIPYGTYQFKVRAKIGNLLSNNNAFFKFTIKPPWYLSTLMLIVYVIFLILFFAALHYTYNRYYTIQRRRMMLKKQREMMLVQLEKDKMIMKLKNENLQSEIKSKTRELAISTMSIVKKNELLNSIKSELTSEKNNRQVKTVLKIIDKNIENKDDWKVFQKAFNDADRDFLKKIKQLHPKLTPTDLKLCVYLRMNLSSKEIAPLLNISLRSVEIKRYRLRKKMDLLHKDNLVEYILNI